MTAYKKTGKLPHGRKDGGAVKAVQEHTAIGTVAVAVGCTHSTWWFCLHFFTPADPTTANDSTMSGIGEPQGLRGRAKGPAHSFV